MPALAGIAVVMLRVVWASVVRVARLGLRYPKIALTLGAGSMIAWFASSEAAATKSAAPVPAVGRALSHAPVPSETNGTVEQNPVIAAHKQGLKTIWNIAKTLAGEVQGNGGVVQPDLKPSEVRDRR